MSSFDSSNGMALLSWVQIARIGNDFVVFDALVQKFVAGTMGQVIRVPSKSYGKGLQFILIPEYPGCVPISGVPSVTSSCRCRGTSADYVRALISGKLIKYDGIFDGDSVFGLHLLPYSMNR